MRRGILAALVLLSMALVPSLAAAENAERYKEEIAQYNARVIQLRENEAAQEFTADLAQVETWTKDALKHLEREEFEAVKDLVRRAEVQLDLIDANVYLVLHRNQANLMEEEIKQLRQELVTLKAKKKEYEGKERALGEAVEAQKRRMEQ